MNQVTHHANRVIDHIVKQSGIPRETIESTLKISLKVVERSIRNAMKTGVADAMQCADILIKQWDLSDPTPRGITDYSQIKHKFNGIEFQFKLYEHEIHVFFETPHGHYLNCQKVQFMDTDAFKDAACAVAWNEYEEKVKTMQL